MSRRAAPVVAGALSVLVAAAPAPATAGAFWDSFEEPPAPAGGFHTYRQGAVAGPWTVIGGDVDLIGGGFWAAQHEAQSMDLNGTAAGAIRATFRTTLAATYRVGFRLAGNPSGGPAVKTGVAGIDGQERLELAFDTTGRTTTTMGYAEQWFTFRATRAETSVEFVSTTPGAHGPVLDNVLIQPCTITDCTAGQ
ncbi:choice-of-anchor C family protein [Catenuloplanes atrovinosus]|uniref:Choice-of-anchor C domain-containing protein n=1 Tax=Catenuloplanes atrovinosus TaxID=137266 RepID=A0AAE3YMS6_9ACTN|nr:choice-of-anchor C family protein [Catenuloplanes atrovinosus]MDR7276653.1 choice-of-anchor C domain-containing protein [Catenuloplanes atrovinosus]